MLHINTYVLCRKELSLTFAVEKARAAEAVNREALHFLIKTEVETLISRSYATDMDNLVTQELTCIHKNKY